MKVFVVMTETGWVAGVYSTRALAEVAGHRLDDDDEGWELQEFVLDAD